MTATGLWLPTPDGTCAAWLSAAASGPARRGVLILPAIGYEYSSGHRFARTLAEQLARAGCTALRLDYWATGDSDGRVEEVTTLDPWRRSVRAAAEQLRRLGCTDLVVVGLQLGALLAVLELDDLAPSGLVTVAPALSGRRFVRGLSVLGVDAPDDVGGTTVGGTYFSGPLLEQLAGVQLAVPAELPHHEAGPAAAVAAFLQRPAEEAVVDPELVAGIAAWVAALPASATGPAHGPADAPAPAPVAAPERAVLAGGPGITERFVTLTGLVGVLTEPASPSPTDPVLVLLNSGSDPHTGPGRAWVELARHLARDGRTVLRIDFRGWGESPDGPSTPGRPYDAHGAGDIDALVAELHAAGREVVLAGLCAGAWMALDAARRLDLAGVVVLNPQLYWQPGDPVEALLTTTRARRLPEIEQLRAGAEAGRWDAEDAAGERPPAGVWLDELATRELPVSMLFAEGDDGLEYLRDRLARRVAEVTATGAIRVIELPGVDHAMQRTWLRPAVFDRIGSEVDRVLAGPAQKPDPQ